MVFVMSASLHISLTISLAISPHLSLHILFHTHTSLSLSSCQVTMGKIYTELEAARLTRHLTDIKEREGDVAGASKCLQELTVETIGAMDMREKAEILLEQIRLCVATKDFIRANMISKKVKVATLDKDEFFDLKLKYCSLMTKYFTHESDMFGLAQLNHSLYKTPKVNRFYIGY